MTKKNKLLIFGENQEDDNNENGWEDRSSGEESDYEETIQEVVDFMIQEVRKSFGKDRLINRIKELLTNNAAGILEVSDTDLRIKYRAQQMELARCKTELQNCLRDLEQCRKELPVDSVVVAKEEVSPGFVSSTSILQQELESCRQELEECRKLLQERSSVVQGIPIDNDKIHIKLDKCTVKLRATEEALRKCREELNNYKINEEFFTPPQGPEPVQVPQGADIPDGQLIEPVPVVDEKIEVEIGPVIFEQFSEEDRIYNLCEKDKTQKTISDLILALTNSITQFLQNNYEEGDKVLDFICRNKEKPFLYFYSWSLALNIMYNKIPEEIKQGFRETVLTKYLELASFLYSSEGNCIKIKQFALPKIQPKSIVNFQHIFGEDEEFRECDERSKKTYGEKAAQVLNHLADVDINNLQVNLKTKPFLYYFTFQWWLLTSAGYYKHANRKDEYELLETLIRIEYQEYCRFVFGTACGGIDKFRNLIPVTFLPVVAGGAVNVVDLARGVYKFRFPMWHAREIKQISDGSVTALVESERQKGDVSHLVTRLSNLPGFLKNVCLEKCGDRWIKSEMYIKEIDVINNGV